MQQPNCVIVLHRRLLTIVLIIPIMCFCRHGFVTFAVHDSADEAITEVMVWIFVNSSYYFVIVCSWHLMRPRVVAYLYMISKQHCDLFTFLIGVCSQQSIDFKIKVE